MIDTYIAYGLWGFAAIWAAVGYAYKSRRGSFWMAALCAGGAGLGSFYHSFWAMAVLALGMLWALVCTLNTIDLAWRAKAGFVLSVFLGAVLCIWPTAHEMSRGKLPCPTYIKKNVEFRLVAGLDLRGGLRLVYTVDVEEAIKDKRNRYYDDIRAELTKSFGLHKGEGAPSRKALGDLEKHVTVEKDPAIASLLYVSVKKTDDIKKLDALQPKFKAELARTPGKDNLTFKYKVRARIESAIRERAVGQAKETINRRVDELGLREAAVTTRDEDVIVEVPGQDEKSFGKIREIISKTARLEFKMVDDSIDFIGKQYPTGLGKTGTAARITLLPLRAPDGPGKTNMIKVARIVRKDKETLEETKEIFRKWLATHKVPADHELGVGPYMEQGENGKDEQVGWISYYLYAKTDLSGDQIRDAQANPKPGGGDGWVVNMAFTESGASSFAKVTGDNVKRRFAVILDGVVKSAPRINEKIAHGSCQITMGAGDPQKQLEESRQLELVLRAGALPAPIIPSNEQRIGASLGTDAIQKGLYGAVTGAGLVLIFMAMYYHKAGIVADLAVVFNLLLQVAILATFGAAMTLPGIAGLALTVGMAVDANVLINERIREELRFGKRPRQAVDIGYDKALSAIIDGHMTTFISGLILAQYGTGPIKGFAVTLLVGMVASLFTSVVCTRLAFDWWTRARKVKKLSVG